MPGANLFYPLCSKAHRSDEKSAFLYLKAQSAAKWYTVKIYFERIGMNENFIAKAAAVLMVCAAAYGGSLYGDKNKDSYGAAYGSGGSGYYKSSTGTKYQYDLSRSDDRINYSTDVDAQMRDSMSVNPDRTLDRMMGQFGGGIED